MNYKFKEDPIFVDGKISLDYYKKVIRDTKFLTPKEKNLLIRLQKEDEIKSSDFPYLLYKVRYEIAQSEMMDSQIDELEALILKEFIQEDHHHFGVINVR